MNYQSPLYIDAREDDRHHWSYALRHEGIDARIGKNLPADFMFQCPTGLILIERKTWPDFVASVLSSGSTDGQSRISRQLIDTTKSAALRVLLLEGPQPQFLKLPSRIVHADNMDNMLVTLQWQYGVMVIHSIDHDNTAHRLASFFQYCQKEDHNALIRPQPPVPEEKDLYMNPDFKRKVAAFMTVPKLGEKGVLLLSQNSGSPKDLVNMTQEELTNIKGVGKIVARNFVEFFERW